MVKQEDRGVRESGRVAAISLVYACGVCVCHALCVVSVQCSLRVVSVCMSSVCAVHCVLLLYVCIAC